MFNLQVTKNKITATETEILVAGSSKVYEVYFEFDSDWADLQEKICFTIDAELSTTPLPLFYLRLDESGKCYIPKWILDDTFIGKDLLCGACGTRGNETILPTVWISLGEIQEGAAPDPDVPSLQPDEYQELREDIGDLSNLTTDDKSNLVAAINELDGKIGEGATGNVSSEQIDRIVVLDLEEYEQLPEKAERTLYAIKG